MKKNKQSFYINILFYISIFFLSLGQIERISLLDNKINFYIHEILVVVFILIGLFQVNLKFKKKINLRSYSSYWLFFIIWCLVSFIFGSFNYSLLKNLISFFYLIRLVTYTFFFTVLKRLVEEKVLSIKNLNYGLLFFIFFSLVTSTVQYFFYPNLRNLYYLGWDPHWNRIFGLFFDTSVTSIILGVSSLYLFHNFYINKTKNKKFLFFCFFISSLILFFLTYSRIGYIAFSLSILFYLFRQKRYLFIIIFLLISPIIIFNLPRPEGESVKLERLFSIKSRIEDVNQGIKIWEKNNLLGVGYNRIRFNKVYENNPNSASGFSSSYITILVSTGVVGLSIFIAFLYLLFKKLWFDVFGSSFLLMVYFAGIFDNLFFQAHIYYLLCLVLTMQLSDTYTKRN